MNWIEKSFNGLMLPLKIFWLLDCAVLNLGIKTWIQFDILHSCSKWCSKRVRSWSWILFETKIDRLFNKFVKHCIWLCSHHQYSVITTTFYYRCESGNVAVAAVILSVWMSNRSQACIYLCMDLFAHDTCNHSERCKC